MIPLLAQHYFVVAPDMRGYNRSSKPGDPDDPQDLAAYKLPELERDLSASPADIGLPFTPLKLTTGDGETLD